MAASFLSSFARRRTSPALALAGAAMLASSCTLLPPSLRGEGATTPPPSADPPRSTLPVNGPVGTPPGVRVLTPAEIAAQAQGRTTRLIVAFPPGGPVHFVARVIHEQLGKELGQQVIVENKPGANGAIAADYVSRAAADASTLWLTSVGAEASPTSICSTSAKPRNCFSTES